VLAELRELGVGAKRQAAIEAELRRDFELGWPAPVREKRS